MDNSEFDRHARAVSGLVIDMFEINAVYRQNDDLVLSLAYRFAPMRSRDALSERLKTGGYRFELTRRDDGLLLRINPTPRLRIPPLNIIMFILTLFTIYVVPVFVRNLGAAQHPLDATLADLARGAGLQFTAAMMSILFVHEMGHFIASRRRNIVTSWPYFIPAPNIIGTFGAIIKSKSPFFNRRDLIEVGAAGPIAGWIVALFWLIYGISQSGYFPPEVFVQSRAMAFSLEGESLLMRLATLGILGPAPAGHFLRLTEGAFAGWVGLLVTAINMLPIGQLDGGHVLYGLFRRVQHKLGLVGLAALLALGFLSPMWWLFAGVGLVFGIKHPPTLQDEKEPSVAARVMGYAALVILVLSFTPVPFR